MGGLFAASQVAAQATGTITGRVVDSTAQTPLSNVQVAIPGTSIGTLSRGDGTFTLSSVPAGSHRVHARRIGYGLQQRQVTVTAGQTATVQFALSAVAANLSPVVVTGYGTQRREAVTGSVSTVDADVA
ncbi:MAG: beta-sandwich domain-containing protein, partial [Gemmatimonadaceae bacterium]